VATSRNGSAVIYCRVSTAEQVQNLSLSTQEKLCRDYCGRQGWDVAKVFIEQGESAKTANRTELQNLLTYCREHKRGLAAVVVYSLNRFSRDSKDHHILRGLLLGFGIALRIGY
jgi:site-specific DNA recombinase